MDSNLLGSLLLIIVSVALIFFAIHGIKTLNQRKKIWEEFYRILKEVLEEMRDDQSGNVDEKKKEG